MSYQPAFPQQGTLYKKGLVNGLPVWSQPNGPGTPVVPPVPALYPAVNQGYYQWPFAYPALYYSGCGHPLNCWEVFELYDPYTGLQAALICCPLCSWIQSIIEPYEDYYDYITTPIVTA